jgi:acyl-CoA synthetase (AMP-forming)/AMP-acid ligase II
MKDLQIQAHEMVALNGPNSAEFLLLVFALEAIGARPSYINHNLTGPALHHCITLCEPRIVLADRETTPRIEPGKEDLAKAGGIQVVYYDEQLFTSLVDTAPLPAHRSRDGIQAEDVRSLIYTSGTTGLPKGVMMLTGRTLFTARNMAKYLELKQSDKFYTCLPLYHGKSS